MATSNTETEKETETMELTNSQALHRLHELLREIRTISIPTSHIASEDTPLLTNIQTLSSHLLQTTPPYPLESSALQEVLSISTTSPFHGGLGLSLSPPSSSKPSPAQISEILFLISAHLFAITTSTQNPLSYPSTPTSPPGRRPMTLSEKIFAAHAIPPRSSVSPGEVIIVSVDWILASELSWAGMERDYNAIGKPGIFRNDRFWLAGDHVVDPRLSGNEKVRGLVESAERAKRGFRMTEMKGMNYTIMHTEFYRTRAQPGHLIIGSDSHTCSSGALGCLAIGLGVADVTMPLVTGQTWFKVPECLQIRLINTPSPGIGGKDVILYILKELKRNTVAAERIVEFTGPGVACLSADARFAIANMTTEFGGITGAFVPDEETKGFVEKRRVKRHTRESRYFRPDEDAVYAETCEINLEKVVPFIARYPSPDDVVAVTEMEGMGLDGVFIGACTTAEEDLILGALVLELGLKRGMVPVKRGKRKVVPGSLPILQNLRDAGLVDVYEKAGFEIGVPGCSYCVGMGADRAGEGETWLSSQNRNFKNRMGTGSFGHIASSVTVAASSFEMKVKNPHELLQLIDQDRLNTLLGRKKAESSGESKTSTVQYVEPVGEEDMSESQTKMPTLMPALGPEEKPKRSVAAVRRGKIQRFGDFVDTDSMAPNDHIVNCVTAEDFGKHCLEYTHPDFREKVKQGYNVVVAGRAWGCGSSRDVAVTALIGAGVQCVIAESFAFIYARNQPNLGLLGFTIGEPVFFELAEDGEEITIDLDRSCVSVGGKEFGFELSAMEKELTGNGGISDAFRKFGKNLFEVMCKPKGLGRPTKVVDDEVSELMKQMEW